MAVNHVVRGSSPRGGAKLLIRKDLNVLMKDYWRYALFLVIPSIVLVRLLSFYAWFPMADFPAQYYYSLFLRENGVKGVDQNLGCGIQIFNYYFPFHVFLIFPFRGTVRISVVIVNLSWICSKHNYDLSSCLIAILLLLECRFHNLHSR